MSKLGPMQLESKSEGVFLGRDYTKSKNFSDQVALEIDKEVRRIIEECYEEAKKILKANEELVNLISSALIKYETLTKEQIDYIVATGKIDFKEELTVDELREIAKSKKIKDYLKMSEEELRKELDVD